MQDVPGVRSGEVGNGTVGVLPVLDEKTRVYTDVRSCIPTLDLGQYCQASHSKHASKGTIHTMMVGFIYMVSRHTAGLDGVSRLEGHRCLVVLGDRYVRYLPVLYSARGPGDAKVEELLQVGPGQVL